MTQKSTRVESLREIASGRDHRQSKDLQQKPKSWLAILFVVSVLVAAGFLFAQYQNQGVLPLLNVDFSAQDTKQFSPEEQRLNLRVHDQMVKLPGGEFLMGLSTGPLDNQPEHIVRLSPFSIDQYEVTNAQFAIFVQSTGYQTFAERRGSSFVYDLVTGELKQMKSATWKNPQGPDSTIIGRENFPVVQVSWVDANAYAEWAGKRLPTEAEWEYAARALLSDAVYPWGREPTPAGQSMCNTGPNSNLGIDPDNFSQLAPIGQFPSSRFQLYDMIGNADEWCADYYAEEGYQVSTQQNPQGPVQGLHRVIRGGNWTTDLSASFSKASSWRRNHADPNFASDLTGFRCVK